MRRLPLLAVGLAIVLSVCLALAAAGGAKKEEVGLASMTEKGVVLEVAPPSGKAGDFEFTLYGPRGKKLASVSGSHDGAPFEVTLSQKLDVSKRALYAVEWSVNGAKAQRRSLHFLAPILETVVVAPRDYLAGATTIVRVVVKDRASGALISGASVEAKILTGKRSRRVYSGKTDGDGVALVALDFKAADIGGHRLVIVTEHRGQRDEISEAITVKSGAKVLLTTDKPLYQPGQTIHMRALTLVRPDMKSASDAEITFEVEDSRGNKVFKKKTSTDAFGVAFADFVLASELNKGVYKIRAVVAGARQEKSVTVDRYVLPKFKIDVTTEQSFYAPGAQVKGEIQVDYFFGKPVAGANVEIDCSKFDVAFEAFTKLTGKTDAKGHYSWSVTLPGHFVGQPLLAGKALAKFDVTVTDTADHAEEVAKTVTVAKSPLILAAVPESGVLIPGLPNQVYIVSTYADGTAARTTLSWSIEGEQEIARKAVATDDGGFCAIEIVPPAKAAVKLHVEARDAKGNTAEGSFDLTCDDPAMADRVLLHIDKALFQVGDAIRADVLTTSKAGTVYFDVVKDGQTMLTQLAELRNGRASFEIAPDATLAGTVTLSAWMIARDGNVVRDLRLVVVDPADQLSVKIIPVQETYRPGEDASISVRTTDKGGKGVAAAIVISVVDEAVFALQEMQPGLEKIFFYLEQEIAKPRYEIHGWDLPILLRPMDQTRKINRDSAARVLLASAQGTTKAPGIQINTFVRDNKDQAYQHVAGQALASNHRAIVKAMAEYGKKLKEEKKTREQGYSLGDLVNARMLAGEELHDPWGGAIRMIEGQWCSGCQLYHAFALVCDGPDRIAGTADDIRYGELAMRDADKNGRRLRRRGGVEMLKAMAAPMAADAVNEGMEREEFGVAAGEPPAGGMAGGDQPRLRSYFPETLLWMPNLITDGQGRAQLVIPLADSITTWRMTAMANSQAGLLGSTTGPLRVFQDFFVDIDFPVALTQNDRVWAPVAVYNYLKEAQKVRLAVQVEDWFELDGEAEQTLTIGPGEVKGVKFPIIVKGIGRHRFTVKAFGTKMSDAIARSVDVVPDGAEHLIAQGGRLEGNVTDGFTIPAGAIAGASKAHLKIYPGVFSQLVEGLDKILRMPGGCFEQTSSATYPNILVLDYMKTTGIVTPELAMKAEGLINQGYQRLLSFEVDGGGFEWFGNAPAHKILTAYGLMEFYDMSQVFNVDPAVISRTQNWLASQQEKDGSWKPSAGGIREGAINKFTDDVFRNTAYIALALASTGYQGDAIDRAQTWMLEHIKDARDTYTVALAVNTFAAVAPGHKVLDQLIEELANRKVESDDVIYWKAQSETPTHGSGDVADIEVTSWVVMGLLRAKRQPAVVSKAITYLVKQKDAYGTWQSTQATIVALKAMMTAEKEGSQKARASIAVTFNDQDAGKIEITPEDSDVMRIVDLTTWLADGENTCKISFEGEGSLFYQVAGSYWTPHPVEQVRHLDEPLSIDVAYDKTELATNDTVRSTVTVENRTDRGMKMVIVDVGIPPAFTVLADGLDKLVADRVIQKYSMTGRQIIFYLDALAGKKKLELDYDLVARFPIKAKTPRSTVYQYYAPKLRANARTFELVVSE